MTCNRVSMHRSMGRLDIPRSPRSLRTRLLILAGLSVLPACSGGRSNDDVYPSEPVKVVVPFGAGGGTDSFARIVERAVEENGLIEQPLVIVNLGGAGGTIGSRRAKNAPPDGHTVMVLHNAILTAKQTRLVDYGPEAFEPVAATGFVGQVVAVWADRPNSPETLDELMQQARDKPGELRWACNLGALTHFSGLQLEQSEKGAGARFNFVPAGGGADRFAALKGGNADVTGFSLEEYTRYQSEGLRGLCFLGSRERLNKLPPTGLRTARELGYEEVVRDNLFYWWMPRGTPPDRIEKFAGVLEKVMQLPEVREQLLASRISPEFERGDQMKETLRQAEERNSRIRVPPPPSLPNFPLLSLAAVGLLGVVVVARDVAAFARRRPDPVVPEVRDETTGSRIDLAVAISLAAVAYVTSLSFGWLDFRIATVAFVTVAGGLMVDRDLRKLAVVMAVALVVGLGVHGVFTGLFEIVLP